MSDGWRIYFDQDSGWKALAKALERAGMDCVTSDELGHERLTDALQLEYAVRERRVLVTCNRGDFTRIHWSWISARKSHAGIIAVRQNMRIGDRLRLIEALAARNSPDQMGDRLVYLGSAISIL